MTLALTESAMTGMEYLGDTALRSIAQKIEKEIGNFGLDSLDHLINRYLPGKRNKRKRKVIKAHFSPSTQAAVAHNVRVNRTAPRFRSTRGRYIVSNREFVSDVRGSTDFRVEEFSIQPGSSALFPWLSQIAPTHQKYRFTKLVFSFVPLTSTTTRGRVTLAYAIDPLDDDVQNKQQLFQYPT